MTVVQENALRQEHFEAMTKGFALQEFVMKQVVSIRKSNAWTESYFQETATELVAGATAQVKGVPRLAQFPYGEVSFTKKSSIMVKHAMEGVVSIEDAKMDYIDIVARTLLRIARAVARSVDLDIVNVLSEGGTATNINGVTITGGNEWDSATLANRKPITDILQAKQKIAEANYNPDANGYLILNPKNYANLLAEIYRTGAQAPELGNTVGKNGNAGRVVGLTVLVTNSMTADKALVLVGQECGTYQVVDEFKVVSIEDAGVKWTIRAWEIGITQLISPKAVTLLTNTDA